MWDCVVLVIIIAEATGGSDRVRVDAEKEKTRPLERSGFLFGDSRDTRGEPVIEASACHEHSGLSTPQRCGDGERSGIPTAVIGKHGNGAMVSPINGVGLTMIPDRWTMLSGKNKRACCRCRSIALIPI
jgi:hypothetical protein